MADIIRYILEIAGTIAFAVSGALVAIGAGLDLFGVTFIGAVTAVGGGILRDIILGINPPFALSDLTAISVAIFVSLVVFIVAYRLHGKFGVVKDRIEHINNFFDAVGLAAFSVMGTEVAFVFGFSDNMFLAVTLGVLTGIGGGIFRDILTDTTPFVFKKHIYAIASIIGACLYYLLRISFDNLALISAVSMILVVVIRMLATKYHWSLPKIKLDNEK
jgi:uncharacterized membrane protein YeiH